MDVHVVPVAWDTHRESLRAIRGEVFIDEQGVPQEIEWDGQDDDAHHFLAINQAGLRIGCVRLLPDGQIGRMAVLKPFREGGIGRQLLDAAIEQAKSLGMTRVFLHAQTSALGFYTKAGFLPEGGEFMEAGIPHQGLSLALPIPFERPADVPRPVVRPEPPPPDSSAAALIFARGETECLGRLADALAWPTRNVRIYSQELDHALFDQEAVVEALSTFIRSGPPTRLQVLIHSSSAIISRGHRLLTLARRLDSKIEIRLVPRELADDKHCCVICDESAYWLLPDHLEYQSLSNRFDPVQAGKLAERFDYLWDRSAPDPELRTLRL